MKVRSRLAVDFGTSHTIAVVQRQEESPRSLLFDGSPILPSSVCLGDDGVLHVGRDAQRMALVAPTRFEPHPKRRIDDGTVLLGDTEIPVVELLAGVLRRVGDEARQAGLTDPAAEGVVLTCPADWGAARRAVLTQAAEQAGLGQVRLVDEPVAAATYCLAVEQGQVGDGQPLVVFDFGGGTFDVALVRRERESWRVLATGGLDDLGGVDVDAALVGHLGQLLELRDGEAWRRLASPDTPAELRDRHTFWTEVRAAKEMLSRVTTAPVQVPRTDDTLHLTREELERVAGPLVARAVDETRRVLQRAGVDPTALAGIFLVGGSSRLPLVATRLHTRFGIAPSVPEQPELPVAHGALLATTTPEPTVAPEAPSQTGAWPAPAPTGTFTAAPPPHIAPAPTSPAPVSASPTSGPPVSGPPGSPVSAMPGASSPVSAAPVSPVPPPPMMPPPIYRPPAPKRSSAVGTRARVILTLVTVGVVVLMASGGISALNGISNWVNRTSQSAREALNGTSIGATGKLTTVKTFTAPAGASALAAVATPTTGYYAVSAANKTQVTGQPTNGGKPWTVDLAMHPEDLKLTVVGDLLIVDGYRSVRHGGKNARAVVDTKTHRKLWENTWDSRWDVGYFGTDAVVELADGFNLALARVNLRTGTTKWSRPGPRDLIINGSHRGQVALSWPTAKTPASPIAVPGDDVLRRDRGLQEYLHSGTEVVEFGDDDEVAVLNAGTGKPRVRRGGFPDINQAKWTVYEGLLLAVASQNGQETLFAYRLTDLREVWKRPANPGTRIESIAPCGPKLFCEMLTAGSDDRIVAVNTATGKDAWQVKAKDDWSSTGMVVTSGGLLIGSKPFSYLDDACLVDFAGKTKKTYDESYRLIAHDGKRIVSVDPKAGGWDVFVATMDGGKRSPAVSTSDGEGMPRTVSLAGDTVVFTTEDVKKVHVLKVSDLPAT